MLNKFYLSLLFFLLLFTYKTSIAQNYRNIPVHGNLYFIDSLNYIFPIDPDSIKFENGDSVIYHFKSLRLSKYIQTGGTDPYYNLVGDAWSGGKTIMKSDTSTIWLSKNEDSIIIKNKAKEGNIWIANGKRKVYGKVTSHILKTFSGITDSVKYITIGVLNTVTSDVNGKKFWLSKNYGFINMPDIYNFYEPSTYRDSIFDENALYKYPYTGPMGNVTLFGSNLIQGTKTILTERLLNDFNIGDKFHLGYYSADFSPSCSGSYTSYSELTNSTIKSKEIISLMDSVVYEVELCGISTLTSKANYFGSGSVKIISFNNRKTQLRLPYRQIGSIPLKIYFDNRPQNNTPYSNSNYSSLIVENGLLKKKYDGFPICSRNDTAVSYCPPLRLEADISCDGSGIEGTGFYSYSSVYDQNNTICPSSSGNCLEYFKKGSLSWGTPNNFSCDTLTPRTILGVNETNLQKSITIQPNPFSENISIKSDGRIQNVNIYTLQMQLMHMIQNISNQEVTLNLNNLPSGLYIAEVILTDQRKAQYKIIKSD